MGDAPERRHSIASVRTGTLRAYNASDGKLLWRSDTNKARDDLGYHAKFCFPTIANGKVYVGTWTGSMIDAGSFATTSKGTLEVYGPLP